MFDNRNDSHNWDFREMEDADQVREKLRNSRKARMEQDRTAEDTD